MAAGGILLVTGLIFAGFWHAFAALTLAEKSQDQFNVPHLVLDVGLVADLVQDTSDFASAEVSLLDQETYEFEAVSVGNIWKLHCLLDLGR